MQAPDKKDIENYLQARSAYSSGNFQEAERLLENLNQTKSLSPQAPFLLAKTLFMQGRSDESLRLFEKLLERYPEHADARLWLARAYLAVDAPGEAEDILVEAMVFSGEDPRVLSLMATCQEVLGETDKALDYYRRAALFEDEMVKIYLSLSALYGRNRMEDPARAYLEKAEAVASEDSLFATSIRRAKDALE